MRPPSPISISPDEEELIKKGTACEEFIQQPIWKEVEQYMNLLVEDALHQMRGNRSSNPMVAHRFKLIWQEREALRDRLILLVKGPIKARKDLLIQIEEERQYGQSSY